MHIIKIIEMSMYIIHDGFHMNIIHALRVYFSMTIILAIDTVYRELHT